MVEGAKRTISPEEFAARAAEYEGFEIPDTGMQGELQQWSPKERAFYTPAPLDLAEYSSDWLRWFRHPRLKGCDHFFIFGAGASTLEMDLSPLDGQPVYGINWTNKWFKPTFLQIIDRDPYEKQVVQFQGPRTQIVTSKWCHLKYFKDLRDPDELIFNIHNPAIKTEAHRFLFADAPGQEMTWYENSLGWALNVAHWFRPKKIVLLGFDWGGFHFWGDGRLEACQQNYGIAGNDRPNLVPKLLKLREALAKRRQDIVHVAPTKLPVFPVVPTLKDALK